MLEIGPTPFDVRLTAFGIPIRVHPSFWIISILLGWGLGSSQLIYLWVVCSFFSILVHEMGHALTAEWFGWRSNILLYFGGGLAFSDRGTNSQFGRNLIVALMGPAAGFLLLGIVVVIQVILDLNHVWENDYRHFVIFILKLMNLWWSVFNLLPILPLDGGHICLSLCQMFRLKNALRVTCWIGAIVGGAAAAFFFMKAKQPLAGMMMLMFCLQNVSILQSSR